MDQPKRHYPAAQTLEDIRANLAAVEARILAACQRAGRARSEVILLPVSKTVEIERLKLGLAAGCTYLGENKVQEARLKAEALSDYPIRWSVIGHLQSNKAKYVARFAHEFQALDKLSTAEVLDRRLEHEGRSLDVFIQINSSDEASKYGLHPDEALAFARALTPFSNLNVKGLMTLALFSDDEVRVRACFRRMRQVQARLRQDGPATLDYDQLSMGMSGDFEWAIEEGATLVRVGQAIFGPRPLPDAHYWPGMSA